MHDRFRTTLASAALVASLSVAGVASANGGHGDPGHGKGKGKTKVCKKKHGKGYLVHGLYVGGDLTQVAGAETARWGDDRWSGTVIVEVLKGNKRGRRDVGLSSYAVKDVRVVGAKDGIVPDEGTRLQLIGKQNAGCAPAPTTPTPTTPEPTTPTTPEPTATLSEYSSEEESAPQENPAEPKEVEETESEEAKGKHGKGKPEDDRYEDKGKDRHDSYGDDSYDDDDDEYEDEDESMDEPTPVTDVTIRVVHFKLR